MAILFRRGRLCGDGKRVASASLYMLERHCCVQSRPRPSDPSTIEPYSLNRTSTVCAPRDAPSCERCVVTRAKSCVDASHSLPCVCSGRVSLVGIIFIPVRLETRLQYATDLYESARRRWLHLAVRTRSLSRQSSRGLRIVFPCYLSTRRPRCRFLKLTLLHGQVLLLVQVVHETPRAQVVDRKGVRRSVDAEACICRR